MQLIPFSKLSALTFFLIATSCIVDAIPVRLAANGAVRKRSTAVGGTRKGGTCKYRKAALKKSVTLAKTGKTPPVQKGKPPGKSPKLKKSRRSGHPSAKGKISLFHGSDGDIPSLDISKGTHFGDFSHGRSFYLTDTAEAARKYACVSRCWGATDEKVVVIEYTWDGANAKVHEFTGINEPWKGYQAWIRDDNRKPNPAFEAIHASDMISGPMASSADLDVGLTDFWQYALHSQAAANARLKRVGATTHDCLKYPAYVP